MSETTLRDEPRFQAALKFLQRTGMREFQMRYSDDEEPVVWLAIAIYKDGKQVDAAFDPERAALRLCERLADGGRCTHCGRPSGLDPDSLDTLPLDSLVCWYQYDPELEVFRRGCEGD